MAHIEILKEVELRGLAGNKTLCFQQCTCHYDNGGKDEGYRFIWKTPDGKLKPQRGQAIIPNKQVLFKLINKAKATGLFK